jgi:hypothetical protein
MSMAAAFSAAFVALFAVDADAHRMEHAVSRDEAVIVHLTFGAGQPVANAPYRVYGPRRGPAFASGRTSANGSLAFQPDQAGTWRVTVTDEGGHGAVIPIDVAEIDVAAAMETPVSARGPDWSLLLAGVGYLFGAAGLLALWRARR